MFSLQKKRYMKLITKKIFFRNQKITKIENLSTNCKDWDLWVNKFSWSFVSKFRFLLKMRRGKIQICNYWLWIIKIMFKLIHRRERKFKILAKLFSEKNFWMKKTWQNWNSFEYYKIIGTLWISKCDFIVISNIWLYPFRNNVSRKNIF